VSQDVADYRICRVCDVAWRFIEDPIDTTEDWDRRYYGDPAILEMHLRRVSALESIAHRLTQVRPQRGRLLDVGAGLGIFMGAAARLGWSVEGLEPSRTAWEAARLRTGSPVHLGLLEQVELPGGSYDAVTSFDLLRTVSDPMMFLRRARALLRPGGILVIREVHRRAEAGREKIRGLVERRQVSPGRKAFEFRQCFSPRSLRFAFQAVGLTESWVEPSPVFAEPDGGDNLTASLFKKSLGLVGESAFRLSGRRIVLGPSMLAFGRVPLE
jgi:SAM-dependent methyltransferase